MTKIDGVKVYKDGTMIIHPDASMTVDSIQVPQVDTAYGAGFGDSLTDSDRAFAACREPVGHFLTFIVARDMVDKWFTVDDPDTEESDPALDRTVQKALSKLKFKRHLREALEMSRIFRKSLIIGAFSDAQRTFDLQFPRRRGAELMQLAVYPKIDSHESGKPQKVCDFVVWMKDEKENSPRFGLPVIYKVDRGGGSYLYVHYTRAYEIDYGASVLDKVWDDLTCLRNIRWGAAQWMYRTGGGFPVVGFPAGTKIDKLEAYHNSGAFSNLMSRTAIFVTQNSTAENDGMTFTFEGAAGHSLKALLSKSASPLAFPKLN